MTYTREELASRYYELKDELKRYSINGLHIPAYMHEGIANYLTYGSPTGDFLRAMFSNDLKETALRADDNNIKVLHVYAGFMYLNALTESVGSKEKVDAWIKKGGMQDVHNRGTGQRGEDDGGEEDGGAGE